ncbi:MAG: radical SAM protein [Candidatus Roizmanbacteria bacterium]|nr:radical SAM protein [Candidatus Roizmanbacteria bacterium]
MKTAEKMYIPQGTKAMLPHGGLPEVVSLYMLKLIEKTGGKSGPLGKQFIAQPNLEKKYLNIKSEDPLIEDHNEVAPGVVYKYHGKLDKDGNVVYYGRVLWTVTRFCATYCRFCTRGREVGIPAYVKAHTKAAIAQSPYLSDEEIAKVISFLKMHKEVNEVVLSGGDPLTTPRPYLTKIIEAMAKLQQSGDLDIIRVGTRLPVHNPVSIQSWHYEVLSKIRNPYLMVHVNHPFELTEETLNVLYNFRKIALATVCTQTVFLKGVNDSVEVLYELFTKLAKNGIRPYYLFQNDPVYWAAHFTVPIMRAIKIWEKLRPRLSGVAATARFVIDVPFGYGKIPIPEGGAWDVNYKHYKDFRGKIQELV